MPVCFVKERLAPVAICPYGGLDTGREGGSYHFALLASVIV